MRYVLVATMLCFMALLSPRESSAQASKRLKDLSGEDAQKKSWDQVDKINREADGTRSRNEQARKSAGLDNKKHTGGNVTKRHVLPEAGKSRASIREGRKSGSPNQGHPPKKKSGPDQ